MTPRTRLELSGTAFAAITGHALDAYPEECCGVILSDGKHDEPRPLENIQNMLHEKDPETFPRDARTAYTMDHRDLESVLTEAERRGWTVKAFYHSHPDHDAYFSQEDKAFAMPFGEPTYPETAQVVIAVRKGNVGKVGVYAWDAGAEDFVEIAMEKVPDP